MAVEGGSVRFPRPAWRARPRAARALAGRRLPGFVERVISNCKATAVFPVRLQATTEVEGQALQPKPWKGRLKGRE